MGEVRRLERNVFPLEFGNIELTPAQSPFQSEIVGGGVVLGSGARGRGTPRMASFIYVPRNEWITH